MKVILPLIFLLAGYCQIEAQEIPNSSSIDSLKNAILQLQKTVDHVQTNLALGEKKFKRGILISTIGYSVTITGGLLLGGKQNDLGTGLLVAGGTIGIGGTFLLVDSFKYLGRAGRAP